MDSDDQASATAARVSVITGSLAVALSAVVGLILTVSLSHWRYVLIAIVPATLGVAALGSGPPASAGRRLGWIALAVLAVGIAAGLIYHAASPTSFPD